MSNLITLAFPDTGSVATVPVTDGIEIHFTFPVRTALFRQYADDLTITTHKAGQIVLEGFFAGKPPVVVLEDGERVSGEDLLQRLDAPGDGSGFMTEAIIDLSGYADILESGEGRVSVGAMLEAGVSGLRSDGGETAGAEPAAHGQASACADGLPHDGGMVYAGSNQTVYVNPELEILILTNT